MGITVAQLNNSYKEEPSLLSWLPWADYEESSQLFMMRDGLTIGFGLNIHPVDCCSRSEDDIEAVAHSIVQLLKSLNTKGMTTIQFFLSKEPLKQNEDHSFVQELWNEHKQWLSLDRNEFKDILSETHFSAHEKKLRCFVYLKASNLNQHINIKAQLLSKRDIVKSHLSHMGCQVGDIDELNFINFMAGWFNPKKIEVTPNLPFKKSFTYDMTRRMFDNVPVSDTERGLWYFDKTPHSYFSIDDMAYEVPVGLMGYERANISVRSCLLDNLPKGSILSQTIVLLDGAHVKRELMKIKGSAIGKHASAVMARMSYEAAIAEINQGQQIFASTMGLFVKAKDEIEIIKAHNDLSAKISSYGLMMRPLDAPMSPLADYLHHLPFNYQYEMDRKKSGKTRFQLSKNIASIAPLYGRFRGGQGDALQFFNRGGELISFDPLSIDDKADNAHMLWLGNTGSGKSATAMSALLNMLHKHNPRVLIVDSGNSFKTYVSFLQSKGYQVSDKDYSLANPSPVNPFQDALLVDTSILSVTESHDNTSSLADSENRDIMTEMKLAARLMITGANQKEEDRFSQQDESVLVQALMRAIHDSKESKKEEILTQDIISALRRLSGEAQSETKRARIEEMADCMEKYIFEPRLARIFNVPSPSKLEADITRIELGDIGSSERFAEKAIIFMGLMSKFMALVKDKKKEGRPFILLIDECHVLMKSPVTADSILNASKMSRKNGMWLWLLTQNVNDFSDNMAKMLSNIEFWIKLGTSESEIKDLNRYKELSKKEIELLRSLKKMTGKYVEGFVKSTKLSGVIRSIPPKLIFALSMTEQHEQAQLHKIMQHEQVSMIEACQIYAKRGMNEND